MSTGSASRRTVLAAAVALTATAAAASAASAGERAATSPARGRAPRHPAGADSVEYHGWYTADAFAAGEAEGTAVADGAFPALVIDSPAGVTEYTDPHTGRKADWEYARWTSPEHRPAVPGSELIASWNAETPAGTWLRVEAQARYTDGGTSPWYTMGVWASGDADIRRTSVDDQSDGHTSVFTDTLAVTSGAGDLRMASYRLRVTLHRRPGSGASPRLWRVGAMTSDVPDRFEVPATEPGPATGVELPVPRYSQNVHVGRYPEYDNGGEAWCSPTSTQMILEYWGRRPTPEDLAWVNPEYDDPQVCHAARHTYDYQYTGCGNWPFNTAYAATYPEMRGVVTRLGSLTDAEVLVEAGIPLITSQSFREDELDGAGYGTAGHLMTVIGFTEDGDVIANDPASRDNEAVRHVYPRRQWENIWLRTKRYDADGKVLGGTGGVCYVLFPARPSSRQRRALRRFGIC
mgnify:CR=1 FL=1